MRVTGIDHVYVSVTDLERSEPFYDRLMKFLGFRKGTLAIAGERHAHYFTPEIQVSIRPARNSDVFDAYRCGLHHLCLRLDTRAAVDEAFAGLGDLGIEAIPPQLYPEYAEDYYATFFEDPDGIRWELVAHRRLRSLIRDHWDELREFEDPIRKAGLLG